MDKEKYILGGGIAGLIWAYYNPKFKIISETIGGQFNNYFPLGPRYLEDTAFSRKFLIDLGIPVVSIKIRMGYKDEDKILDRPPKDFLQKYYKKSRGVEISSDSTAMNSRKTEMDVLIVNFKKIIDLLAEKIGEDRIIRSKITKIDTNKKEISIKDGKVICEYDKIISSIPLPIFYKLAKVKSDNYRYQSMTYILLKPKFINLKCFDFVYCAGNEPYHRLANDKKGIVADVLGWKTLSEIKRDFPDAVDFKHSPTAQIISGAPQEKFNDNISFIGRYGTWNREWKTEKVIEEAIKYGQ